MEDLDKVNNNGCECRLNMGRGCRFCHQGDELTADVCEGCFKLHDTDWLADYPNNLPDDVFEVRFKNTHRGYYRNVNNLSLAKGDIVAVEASPGHDIGIISLTGDMVARQMKRVGFNPQNGEFRKIYRKAKPYDIERWQEAIALEQETMIRSRQIAAEMNLNMKIGDVEYQGDKIKAIFYYIADERVDFRELIKVFAEQFHIRVEMKQIGARQEAGRIGGIGSCGRQLCCAQWISSFNSVTTNAARTQDMSLNPQKLAGQCSKLKCCLTYELDDYTDARKEFPRINEPLQAMDADYFHVKNDILGRTMSFSTSPGSLVNMVTLPLWRVKEVMSMNREGKKPDSIVVEQTANTADEPNYVNVIGEESITRFDNSKRNKGRNNKRRNKPNGQPQEEQTAKQPTPSEAGSQPRPSTPRPPRDNQNRRPDNRQPRQGQANGEKPNQNRRAQSAEQPQTEEQQEQRRQNRQQPNDRRGNQQREGQPRNNQGERQNRQPQNPKQGEQGEQQQGQQGQQRQPNQGNRSQGQRRNNNRRPNDRRQNQEGQGNRNQENQNQEGQSQSRNNQPADKPDKE